MNYNEVYRSVKKRYNDSKDVLDKEPWYYKLSPKVMVFSAFLFIIWTVLILAIQKGFIEMKESVIIVITCIVISVYICAILFYGVSNVISRNVVKKRIEDTRELCRMALQDEAKARDVSEGVLALYLYKNYTAPRFLNIICFCVSIGFACSAIIYLPNWSKEKGYLFFFVLVIANIIISLMNTVAEKKMKEVVQDELEFFVIKPFTDDFKKIEK